MEVSGQSPSHPGRFILWKEPLVATG